MPPAFATAIDKEGGQAPAIGASRIGIRISNRVQNASMRSRSVMRHHLRIDLPAHRCAPQPTILDGSYRRG
jgi:hypothetical protein